MSKANKKWDSIFRIMVREWANTQTSAMLYKSVVQAILLIGSETWY